MFRIVAPRSRLMPLQTTEPGDRPQPLRRKTRWPASADANRGKRDPRLLFRGKAGLR